MTSEASTSVPADRAEPPQANADDPARATLGTGQFWRELAAQLHATWAIPTNHPGVELVATVCFLFRPDGTIAEAKMDGWSGDVTFDTAAARAMADVQSARNAQPVAVPVDQLPSIQHMVCFRLAG